MIHHVLYFDVRNRAEFVRIGIRAMDMFKGDCCLRLHKVYICVAFLIAARLAGPNNGTRFVSTMKSQGLT